MLLPAEALADVVRVVYRVEATAGSWQPLSPSDLSRAIEHAALEVLTKPGLMQLERARGPGDAQAPGDYELVIGGNLLDEAETHTVNLSFGPGEKSDVPSVSASETVVLSKLPRGKMLDRIESSARTAAARLVTILKPRIRHASSTTTEAPPEPFADVKQWPWSWSEVRIPRPSVGAVGKDLYSKNHDKRSAALRVLTSLALRESSPRQALERCALEHFHTETRRGCLEALRPLTANSPPTQRVVTEVFRKDADSRIRGEASAQMTYFTGPAREAAVQAWLEAASLGASYGPLANLGDVPNLDLAVKQCLVASQKNKKTSRSSSTCLDLLDPLPYARRRAILWRFVTEMKPDSPYYLDGLGEREGSHGTPWGSAVKLLLEPAPQWDRAFEDVLWERYRRTLSSTALDVLATWAPPSKKAVDRLLEILKTTGNRRALRGLERMGKDDPKLAPKIEEALAELLAMGAFPKDVSASDLERTLEALRRAEAKR